MSPILEVSGLSKRFGKVVTAEDLAFSVEQGSAMGIVGPNGAGKSTLLSLITGVLPADAGTIVYDGQDITRLSAGARSEAGIARTFQIPRPFVDMTVFENAYVGAAFGGDSHGQAGYDTAAEALEITGLLHLADVPAGQLRLLDRKRLELARALATGPKLILLDEIAGGLTEKELPPLIEMIKGLHESGVTVIWIEHIVHALLEVVDQLMCLAFGKVLAIGDPHEVMRSPEVIEVYLGSTFDLGGAAS
ncbi:MAG: ATP-binding cassette domain-containing protein [Actinomycetales bacterium]|nr:ATP-binding cassette domain-containing protein [Actinomycetales bacterium]